MNKFKAIFIVVVISLIGTVGSDEVNCYFNYCSKDDGVLRAEALIGPALVVIYVFYTLLAVFFPSVWLSKFIGITKASFIFSLVSALVFSWLLYSPEIDTMSGVLKLFAWLFLPWVIATAIGCSLWPNK